MGIAAGAQVNVQSNWNATNNALDSFILNKPTKLSDFTNDSGFITSASISGKEDKTNKKTTITNNDTDYPTTKAVKTALDTKQDTLLFTPENVANKKTTVTSSDVDYPTGKAVKTELDKKQPIIMTGTCATAAATAAKVVTLDSPRSAVTPSNGDIFLIKYTLGTTVSTATININ